VDGRGKPGQKSDFAGLGKSAKSCQTPFAKIFLFFRMANQR
jgi:hypothetical protein